MKMNGNHFLQKRTLVTLTIRPSALKITTGQVLANANRHVEYESALINSSLDNERNTFLFYSYKRDHCDLDV